MAFDTQLPLSDYAQLRANYTRTDEGRALIVNDPSGRYHMFPHNLQAGDGGFWQVQLNHLDLDSADKGRSGWKCHVSFHPDDMEQAWSLAAEHLMKKDIGLFKVTGPRLTERFGQEGDKQAGKFITVYETGDAQNIAETLGELEQIFAEHGIRPGPDVQGDRKVPGSRFLSYRNDKDANGQYVSGPAAPGEPTHNRSGQSDPWQGFRIIPPPPIEQVQAQLEQNLQRSFNHYLPNAPVSETKWTGEGYRLTIPADYSRQQFTAAGVDVEQLTRQNAGNGTHHLHVPKGALTSHYDPAKAQAKMTNFINLASPDSWQKGVPTSAPQRETPQRSL